MVDGRGEDPALGVPLGLAGPVHLEPLNSGLASSIWGAIETHLESQKLIFIFYIFTVKTMDEYNLINVVNKQRCEMKKSIKIYFVHITLNNMSLRELLSQFLV